MKLILWQVIFVGLIVIVSAGKKGSDSNSHEGKKNGGGKGGGKGRGKMMGRICE